MPTSKRRDPRVMIYAALDLIHFAAYLFLLVRVAPAVGGLGSIFWLLLGLFFVIGVAMLVGGRGGRAVAVGGCACILAIEVILLALILASAAFLSGVYGAFGRGGAGMAVLAAFLSIQVIALIPGHQLKFLLSRAGRRAFGGEAT